jgi:hypothetical protein|tara:strand:- start:8231 stop:8449 length:219 start_codon:yes stop_codon:yes gene_type:complete
MKLKDYVENLNKLLKERPEMAEYLVVTSKDDEGNEFNEVCFDPTVGCYYEDGKEFIEEYPFVDSKPNAVCVN